jgi:hypothetical protein
MLYTTTWYIVLSDANITKSLPTMPIIASVLDDDADDDEDDDDALMNNNNKWFVHDCNMNSSNIIQWQMMIFNP